jgi:hypothetical protein
VNRGADCWNARRGLGRISEAESVQLCKLVVAVSSEAYPPLPSCGMVCWNVNTWFQLWTGKEWKGSGLALGLCESGKLVLVLGAFIAYA